MMPESTTGRPDIRQILRVLNEQRQVLAIAGAETLLLQQYVDLIRFLRHAESHELRRIFLRVQVSDKVEARHTPTLSEAALVNMPGPEIEKVINSENTTRKDLERLAIVRFRVPSGSMRRFSNREMLVDKILTLLRNELAHRTIEEVARGQRDSAGMDQQTKVKAG